MRKKWNIFLKEKWQNYTFEFNISEFNLLPSIFNLKYAKCSQELQFKIHGIEQRIFLMCSAYFRHCTGIL